MRETTAQDCLSLHNTLRAKHGVGPLTVSRKLEKFAAMRAQQLAKTDIFAHPKKLAYGENLYYLKGRNPTCADAMNAWYNKEIGLYNWHNPGFSHPTGHFTQVLWKATTHVGCASSQSPRTRRIYIVCNYDPPGNVHTQFRANVPPPMYY
ncbi:hypothetical protein B4U80_02575 [Leptotrombidium deliense]|uniref:SCP domain-containing protein n=1 Tax=Leptotrombidium deliense TaxID=299467 RepID=A0A443SA59_9ACAR|nr:hypothetical protein B4U80_02575 [Leptotrombidium deliense]